MSTTITGKLNKAASQFQSGELTGFGLRLGVKYYDRLTKTEQWCNYDAVVFAKAPAQIQFYQQVLVEGTIVEISADKQCVRSYQGANGLSFTIELLDPKLGAIFAAQNKQQAPAQQAYQAPAQQAYQAPAQQAYQAPAHDPRQQPNIDFDDDIPF